MQSNRPLRHRLPQLLALSLGATLTLGFAGCADDAATADGAGADSGPPRSALGASSGATGSDGSAQNGSSGSSGVGGPTAVDPAGIFDGQGGVNADAYRAMAAAYGTPAMMPFRFGKTAEQYGASGGDAPTAWERPIQHWTNPDDGAESMFYSLGSPMSDPGDYSSNEAQVAYVTDEAVADSKPGVDRISTEYMAHGIFSATPQPYWNYSGWGDGNRGRPEQHLVRGLMSDAAKAAFDAAGGQPSKPIEVTRAYGAGEAAGHSLMVFQNGLITTGGIATGNGTKIYYRPFPASYVPTAASVTNNGEFALITVWDTENVKAKLAVLALGSSSPPGEFWGYEWPKLYPGFRNYSLWTFVKLLGYVDLPDMVAPTSVEAVGDQIIGNGVGWLPGTTLPGNFSLDDEGNWNCFKNNPECVYDRSGFALVGSRYERKVTVVDLRPLFRTITEGMFGDRQTFADNIANVGMGDTQWPPTFSTKPDFAPTVAKTLTFDHEVTAMSASLAADNLGLVATEEGTIHLIDVDGLQRGAGTGANAHETAAIQSGRNVTRIAHMKHATACCGDGAEVRHQYVALSRGDKRVEWIDNRSQSIIRTLRDSRLVDPVSVEDNNNHGTFSDVIDILDYGAKKVRAYRYGPVQFNTNGGGEWGMGEDGNAEFEYSGDYDTPTGAFSISIENVT